MSGAEPVITIAHCVAKDGSRYCIPGIREFCRRHGFDYRAFLRHGIPISQVEHIDDAMARQVIARARGASHGQQ